jgi:hypothetical protein
MKAREIKSVSFNANDPIEGDMLRHVSKFSSFSVYVKRLIQRDMEGVILPKPIEKITEINDDKTNYESFL